ncbi:zinc finger protein 786-like [Phocoena sinus]|uniref:zinc finger protein 786-like n=1 Tax=Phocoena sinus TaxID=42100 RepID=UPI0013C4ADA6|nr:zinc finger protein 786-like [Phocoena sinus]
MAEPAPLTLTFEDVAVYFSEQEWRDLEPWQKELYKQVMRTNYEILVSLHDGLPKPKLISWLEQGRELFRIWGESQKSGNIICTSADLHLDPVIEGQLFVGSQQAVKPGEAHCHFQVDPLQSQRSSEPLLKVKGKSEDVSFRPDQVVALLNPQRHDTRALVPVVHSSREPTQRDTIVSPRTLGPPGFQETSGEGLQHPCPVCGEGFWKNLSEQHQGSQKDPPHRTWNQLRKQTNAQQLLSIPRGPRHFRCPECGRGFRRKSCLLRPLAIHPEESQLPGKAFPVPRLRRERPGSRREGARAASEQAELPRLGEKPGLSPAGKERPEALEPGPGAERPASCGLCVRHSSPQCGLPDHTHVHSAEWPFWCAECSQASRQHGRLRLHRRLHSDEQPFAFPECGLGFRLRRHGGERPLSCGECGRGFAHPCKLREHLRVHSGERPFGCPECGKSFRLKGILKAHERTHSRERPFQCTECGKGFTRPSKLAEHFRVHSGERPFGCPDCGRWSRLKGQLRSHQCLHTGESPFPCPDYSKSYRVKADMAHRLLHGGRMPFSCECGKGFAKQSKLVEHIRTHTGEKPFQCPQCDKSFRLKAQLLSHQGLHTGERPFRCPECDKNFWERGHMLRHQRIHRPDGPFTCADCGKGFIYKSKLAEHIRVNTKSCRAPSEPDIKQRLSQLFAMIEADWS